MPSKKKKYNARFPAGRIKKIMQTDDEVGKVAQAVPVIISRTLELFVESLLSKAQEITSAKNAKTLSPSHMKQCILSESRFDFLKELVGNFPDATNCEYEEGHFPSVISSPVESNHSSNDAPSSNSHKKEKSTQNLIPVPPNKAFVEVTSPATSKTINANFYRENEHIPSASNSTGSKLNSSNCGDDELDEDYDTT